MAEPAPLSEEVVDEAEIVDQSSEFDLLFPVVPAELDPFPPDEALDGSDLVEDAEEQQDPSEVEQTAEGGATQQDEFREDVAFDWTALEFFQAGNGEPQRITDADAVVGWANASLNTPKGKYAIFSEQYGSNLQELLGQVLTDTILFAEAARGVTECLLQHPRITKVTVDSIRREPTIADALFIDISMYIDDDGEPIQWQYVT